MGKIYKGKSLWKRYRFLDTVVIYEKIGEILEKKESLLWSIKNIKVSVNLPPIYRQHIRTLTLWQSKTERTVWRESQRYRKRGCPFELSWKGICKSQGITCLYAQIQNHWHWKFFRVMYADGQSRYVSGDVKTDWYWLHTR